MNFLNKKTFLNYLLLPLSVVYYFISKLKYNGTKPYKSKIPVVCVGNVTVGGTGKSPLVKYIAQFYKNLGLKVCILSRGYKGNKKYVWVDSQKHNANDVGDEPLIHAETAGVFIGGDRSVGAKEAIKKDYDIIILDDGFQNNTLKKNFNILTFNYNYPLGNSFLLPAGPLRETITSAKKKADLIVCNERIPTIIKHKFKGIHIFTSIIKHKDKFKKGDYIAFAGIGQPDKFFNTVKFLGGNLKQKVTFKDHHFYNENEIKNLIDISEKNNAELITTEKDYIKIPKKFQKNIICLKIDLEIKETQEFKKILKGVIKWKK